MRTDTTLHGEALPGPATLRESARSAALRAGILELLVQRDGWRSGEELAAGLGISRAAVAKHIAALRADGHAIAAATRKGYRLEARRDELDPGELARGLRTRVFGKQGWHILAETGSTNLDAARLAGEGAPEGWVVFAERQTSGRGRKGHTWISVPRGLQFSLVLRPEGPFWNAGLLTGLGALAVARALGRMASLEAGFKPPNDVLAHGRKLAGVLVETALRGDEPDWAVLGIGCNVNALAGDFAAGMPPEGPAGRLTSVLMETGAWLPRAPLLAAMLEELEDLYHGMMCGEITTDALDGVL